MSGWFESIIGDAHDFAHDNFTGCDRREEVTMFWRGQAIVGWTDGSREDYESGRTETFYFKKADLLKFRLGRPTAHNEKTGRGDLVKIRCDGEDDFLFCVDSVNWERGDPCASLNLGDPDREF